MKYSVSKSFVRSIRNQATKDATDKANGHQVHAPKYKTPSIRRVYFTSFHEQLTHLVLKEQKQ